MEQLAKIGLDGSLIQWVASFLTDRQAQLVIDGQLGPLQPIASGLPQGSPVSPILLLIYIRGVFQAIEATVPGVSTLSFTDDIGIMARGSSVQDACESLQQAGEAAIQWGLINGVQFDPGKTEAGLFTRQRGRRLQAQIDRARLVVGGAEVRFSPQAIRWLGILLDQSLTLRPHYQDRLQKAKKVEAQIKALSKQQGLPPGALWRIHKATAQAIALYGAEL